jgi:serine/threonine protein kinase
MARSGTNNCLSHFFISSANHSSSSTSTIKTNTTNSECDSLDFKKNLTIKHNNNNNNINSINQLAYNQLLAGSSTGSTTSSSGCSPMWPHKTYIDPHTYEDPTKVINIFARELSPATIIIESVIGGGEFGDVCRGCLRLNAWSTQTTTVAIKTLKGAATEQNRCDFLTEASIMAQFKNENVIRLEGVVTKSHPLMIVTEYMDNGSLDKFLRLNQSNLQLKQMIRMLKDVSNGMKYLADMNYIHRDLAARNILVNKDLVCKVADFGLSREIEQNLMNGGVEGVYTTKGGKIPVRWTALEACLYSKFTCASDVWSFGVLMWEVLSLGERPYWSWQNTDVVKALKCHYRLPPPKSCPDCLYKLMLNCWLVDRQTRPKFDNISLILDNILTKKSGDELRRPAKIQELLPIDEQSPTDIQLTTTKQFLVDLKMDHYSDNFEKNNYGNLSNLFQLDSNDLFHILQVFSQNDQHKVINELKRIKDSFIKYKKNQAQLYNMQTQLVSTTTSNNNTLINQKELVEFQKKQLQQSSNSIIKQCNTFNSTNSNSSIFNLLRNTTNNHHQHHHLHPQYSTTTNNDNNKLKLNSQLQLDRHLIASSSTPTSSTVVTPGDINNQFSSGFLV